MKLAVVLFGQPRFWDLSYKSIIQETTFENSTTDYYFHFWDKIAYNTDDPEYKLTDTDKANIVDAYKPKKYSFTDYSILEETCDDVYRIVKKQKKELNKFLDEKHGTPEKELLPTDTIEDIINNVQKLNNDNIQRHASRLRKTIFEVTQPKNLTYFLGQFVSLQEGAKLVEEEGEEYDYIFRLRTDVLFVTPDLYKNKTDYLNDKQLFYNRIENLDKGIFCRTGDLQIWEGSCHSDDVGVKNKFGLPNYGPKERIFCSKFKYANNKMTARPHKSSITKKLHTSNSKNTKSYTYNPETQYLHMKDWFMVGSGSEMLLSMKQYVNTIIHLIKKSKQFLIENGIDNNWAAGELVCGEVLGLNGICASELGFEHYNKMIIPNRFIKIANEHTKEFILNRPHVRVLADSDISVEEQYKKLIHTTKNSD